MTAVMQGVRILEVAEHTFVPAASALMADWGAEVIKIEHVERGDAMRSLASSGTTDIPADVHVLLEHSNRGKRSLALDLTTDEGLDILHQLAAKADIFLTNKLPGVRKKLRIDVEDIRAANPKIIYVRGTGQGAIGPDADKGSYDALAFWARTGIAMSLARPEYGHVPGPPGPGFGDSIGAMTIAGGMMGALYHREKSGDGVIVDVSLLSTGMWALGQAISLSLLTDAPWTPPPSEALRPNPLVAHYETDDGRWVSLCCLQAGKYWPGICDKLGRPELAADPRFVDHDALMANSDAAGALLQEIFVSGPLDHWRAALADFDGQWTVIQNTLEVAEDPQTMTNGYIQDCATSKGVPFKLPAAPVQFDEHAASTRRAPDFNEHGDAILAELGLDWETVIDLKVRGVVA